MTKINISKNKILNELIFEIILNSKQTVYMSATPSCYYDILMVDAELFLKYWKKRTKKSSRNLPHGTVDDWRKDYKFKHAELGFSGGKQNPVPLADTCFVEMDEVHEKKYENYTRKLFGLIPLWQERKLVEKYYGAKLHIDFTDGITRTIWLLANGAKMFPIQTDGYSTPRFLKYCKSPNTYLIQNVHKLSNKPN